MIAAKGRFITLEGGEGAGKSTQIVRLADRLRALGHRVLITREPGGTQLAEAIRGLLLGNEKTDRAPLVEALLFNAARADHLDKVIRPAIRSGGLVLCDRFADSTRAYQGAASGTPREVIAALEAIVVGDTRPDLTLILDLPPDVGLARARVRGTADRFEAEDLAFHGRLRDEFLAIGRSEPHRCAIVDAASSESEVADAIWRLVEARLSSW